MAFRLVCVARPPRRSISIRFLRNANSNHPLLKDGVPYCAHGDLMSQVLNKLAKSAYTWNGALSYSTTGFEQLGACLDYWSKAGTYTAREESAVAADMARIFADDEKAALAVVFGLRLISRAPNVEGISEPQTGYGRKDEFYKALLWLKANRPALLAANLHLIPVFGCWKDFLTEPLLSALDRAAVYALARDNLGDALLRKYLPQIRSAKNLRTDRDRARVAWAKGFCAFLGIGFAEYRKLKAEGPAHLWQQQMGRKEFGAIDFARVPGKAMLLHTSQKGKDKQTVFERHDQVARLAEWAAAQPAIKFTGYPYELTRAASHRKRPSLVQRIVYDKQFETVLGPLKGHKLGNVLCALDTSGSMTSEVVPGVSAYDICISMGLVFSALNVGHFRDAVVAFNDTSTLVRLAGSFTERLHQLETMTTAWGSTNFQSVIDLLVRVRTENPGIPVSEYPDTVLVVSDMQFNPVGGNTETNYEAAMRKLRAVGLKDVRIIWWFVNGKGTDFPAQMKDRGTMLIGGFDPAVLRGLLGLSSAESSAESSEGAPRAEATPVSGLLNFLSQPVFGLLRHA
jgi:Domain of unknown function (DUF2828)